jgi:hypothetical protein
MTEAEWLACTDPTPMLVFLKGRTTNRSVKQRKLRLFSVACCRRIWPLIARDAYRAAVLAAERFSDARATSEELQAAESEAAAVWRRSAPDDAGMACLHVCSKEVSGFHVSVSAARAVWNHQRGKDSRHDDPLTIFQASPAEEAEQCRLILDIFGNPFRPLYPSKGKRAWEDQKHRWLSWQGDTIPKLARAIYDGRAFDRLPVLADALEDAGCTDAAILSHCRGEGPHTRGCWVVDLLLGKG